MVISSHINPGISGYLSRSLGVYRLQAGISLKETEQPTEEQNNGDTVTISPKGQDLAITHSSFANETPAGKSEGATDTANWDSQEINQLMELKHRDTEVRIHEQAHLAAAGPYARGGPSFTYQQGPDGVRYAIGGEVDIDLSKEKTPETTISKMQTIKRAALAPASPSGADRSVAAEAGRIESQARQEALMQRQEELLHGDTAENPALGQENDNTDKQKSGDNRSSLSSRKLQTVIAAYQRVAGGH
ncbi:MAG: putative metalloprotease CJM1_0395 family protein [Pseudomonadota bacterium]